MKKNDLESTIRKVTRLGLEPRLFWTKTRRVASYTIGQNRTVKVIIKIIAANKYPKCFK